jgi:hypothetical protein
VGLACVLATPDNNSNIRPLFAVFGSATDGIVRFVVPLVLGREFTVTVFLLEIDPCGGMPLQG